MNLRYIFARHCTTNNGLKTTNFLRFHVGEVTKKQLDTKIFAKLVVSSKSPIIRV